DQKAPKTAEETTTASSDEQPAVTTGEAYPETREKMSGIRKAIASAMVNSKTKAPHVTLLDEVDVTDLVAHRKRFKEVRSEEHTSELQSRFDLVCRLLLEKKKKRMIAS